MMSLDRKRNVTKRERQAQYQFGSQREWLLHMNFEWRCSRRELVRQLTTLPFELAQIITRDYLANSLIGAPHYLMTVGDDPHWMQVDRALLDLCETLDIRIECNACRKAVKPSVARPWYTEPWSIRCLDCHPAAKHYDWRCLNCHLLIGREQAQTDELVPCSFGSFHAWILCHRLQKARNQ